MSHVMCHNNANMGMYKTLKEIRMIQEGCIKVPNFRKYVSF